MPYAAYIKAVGSDPSLVLNVDGGAGASPGTAVVLWGQDPSVTGANELWFFDGAFIVAAFNSNLVLGSSGNLVSVVEKAEGDPTQQWTVASAGNDQAPAQGYLVNSQGFLTVDSEPTSGASVFVTAAASTGSAWTIEPLGVPFGQTTAIETALTFDNGASLVMTVDQGAIAPGTAVVLADLNTNSSATESGQYASNAPAMWQYCADGCIESQLTPGLVLSLGPVNGGLQTVVVYPRQSNGIAFQQWDITTTTSVTDGVATTCVCLANLQNGQYLSVGGSAVAGTALVTTDSAGGSEQAWIDTCGYPLQPILMQPPVAFPSLDPTAYEYASNNVQPPIPDGIRSAYPSMTAGVAADYAQQFDGEVAPPPPSLVPSDVWSATVAQLQAELNDVAAVQGRYAQVNDFLIDAQTNESLSITTLATEFLVPLTETAHSKVTEAIEGVVEAVVT